MDVNLRKLQEIMEDGVAWSNNIHGVSKSWMWLGTEPQQQQLGAHYLDSPIEITGWDGLL